MFGLDSHLAGLSDGSTLLLVLAIAGVLGLRHASDPDHLAAVTTLVAGRRGPGVRFAAKLGLSWGAGHATSLLVFGLPIVLYGASFPEPVQAGAETLVGVVIVGLAASLLVRWRRGAFQAHEHPPEDVSHLHSPHLHPPHRAHGGSRVHAGRTPLQAYGIGLVHGMGGSAGVGVLLLAAIHDRLLAVGSLALFAGCTAISMTLLSTGLGATLGTARARRSFQALAPCLAVASAAFGIWYVLGAQSIVPYVF